MQNITRREFVAAGAAAGVAAGLSPMHAGAAARTASHETAFIHLFLPGGWPCSDLWDPKPHAPFRAGMRGSELTSTVPMTATSVPGMYLGEPLGMVATVMDRGLIVRSVVDETNTLDHRAAQERMIEALTFGSPAVDLPIDFSVTWGLSQALLAATKLTAADTKHARVTWPFEPFQRFDAHEFGARNLSEMMKTIDMVTAAIVWQLEGMGLLDRTIFCVSSEFNRTIAGRPAAGSDLNTGENLIIESERDYGFHAHFAEANSIVLFGGPFKRGFVYGKTGPKHPMRVVENPVTLADIHATVATAMRMTPREGRVITDLLA